MTHLRAPMGCVTVLVSLAACDSRADRDYRGESLLHLEGRVVLADERAPEGLVPAVAFATRHGLEIVDVAVQGHFPADFRMDLYTPPPASAIEVDLRAEDPAEQGEFAMATITAVPRDHASQVLFESSGVSWRVDPELPFGFADLPSCVEDPRCVRAGQKCEADSRCDRVELWCLDDTNTECRTVGLPRCGRPESGVVVSAEDNADDLAEAKGDEACEPLFSEGNDNIYTYELGLKKFAGFSARYVIFWTRRGLPKTTWLLAVLGVEEDLAPGYSLIELGTEPEYGEDSDSDSDSFSNTDDSLEQSTGDPCADDERAPEAPRETAACGGFQCIELFETETFARYNERHGTSFRCLAEVDKLEFDELVEIERELTYIAEKLAMARGLSIAELEGTKVIHDPNTKLSIHISPDAEPPVIF